MKSKNIAIISPNKNAYSETFIQAHKNLKGNIFYYYGGFIPQYLENYGYIGPKMDIKHRAFRFFKRKLFASYLLNPIEQSFAKSLKENNIEVILAEYGTAGADILPIAKFLKIPLFVHFHGYDASVKEVISQNMEKYNNMFDYASKVFAVSNIMKEKLIEMGCPANKIILNTYGPNSRFLKIKPTFSEPRSFVAIGRFVNKKAPYYTILAFKKVTLKYPDVKLYFGGEGELLEVSKNLIRVFQLENNIELMGRITPEEFEALLSKVSGFLQHSITAENGDMEGTPVAVLEASAAGIPVIATRHAGIPDVILDGKTGLLVDEHDVNGMANKIMEIIENPEKAKKMGAAGKERVKENFTMEKHLKTIENTLLATNNN
ncbi:glycosyltransferase [Anaerophaga thermohalophila]|uniref:glycosyltransferase n=1 Tax=Anaerophaga thermohalophila TaxID=177400 RepID=UPI000237D3AE|nr:glycosyltransferase [Anaerophaga thermohalophila]